MDIDKLIRGAVKIIEFKFGLPKSGFIAGGSIANIVWELVSGKESIINDVDVFIFDGLIENVDIKDSLFKYQESDRVITESYSGIKYSSINKDFYTIEKSEHEGIFNKVWYKSNKVDTDIILRSFDINCTRVGYSIDEDKAYWLDDFEKFLNTGELKVCNLMTPSHTAIRIVKKSKELDCILDQFELDLIKYTLSKRFTDVIKLNFMDRYCLLYNQYFDDLKDHFSIKRDFSSEDFVKIQFQKDVNLYHLKPINIENYISRDNNIQKIYYTVELIFYIRNIYGNKDLSELWSKLYFFFDNNNYIDCNPSKEDLELISRLCNYAPNTIEKLRGKKLSEQIDIVKWILGKFEKDPIVAISILEKHHISKDLDDMDLLLLELSVRKNIHNEVKAKNILKVVDKNSTEVERALENSNDEFDW
jgi:hypothetical protein